MSHNAVLTHSSYSTATFFIVSLASFTCHTTLYSHTTLQLLSSYIFNSFSHIRYVSHNAVLTYHAPLQLLFFIVSLASITCHTTVYSHTTLQLLFSYIFHSFSHIRQVCHTTLCSHTPDIFVTVHCFLSLMANWRTKCFKFISNIIYTYIINHANAAYKTVTIQLGFLFSNATKVKNYGAFTNHKGVWLALLPSWWVHHCCFDTITSHSLLTTKIPWQR